MADSWCSFSGMQKKGIKLGSAQQEKVEKGLEIRTLKPSPKNYGILNKCYTRK